MKFDIKFDRIGVAVLTPLGCGRTRSAVVVSDTEVTVWLGWAFRARFPRSSITAVARRDTPTISRGAHGWSGRWLVNGAGDGLVTITVDPRSPASVMGVPVHLRELVVSAVQPDELVGALVPLG